MSVTPIVVVAYNRAKSLKRLLDSLNEAVYFRTDIPLIISIDKGDNEDVLHVAEIFEWRFGTKKIEYQSENLKLRKHIIKCGDKALEYGGVIILEDDLYVSPYFYEYAIRALDFSAEKSYICGISLFNHDFNVNVSEPFYKVHDGYDNWYLQIASSWGEAWTKNQWIRFKNWYAKNDIIKSYYIDMPRYICNWKNTSWLKYFIRYLIDNDGYFMYPKVSLTTNFGECGIHNFNNNSDHQVLLQLENIDYRFSDINESKCVYDSFFENKKLENLDGCGDVCVDLYGHRVESSQKKYLTRKVLDYKIIRTYGCYLRPHEMNILKNIDGQDFFLYDTTQKEKNIYKENKLKRLRYNLKIFTRDNFFVLLKWLIYSCKNILNRKLKDHKDNRNLMFSWIKYRVIGFNRSIRIKLAKRYINRETFLKNNVKGIEEGNIYIYNKLMSKEAFAVGRYGASELKSIVAGITDKKHFTQNALKKVVCENVLCRCAGFFPNLAQYHSMYSDLMCELSSEIDAFLIWNITMEDFVIDNYASNGATFIVPRAIEPWYCNETCWTEALEGKKVLVIHPFAKTIKKQYEKREFLFENKKILPKFDLYTDQAVQTIAEQKDDRFANWFEALDWMYDEAMKINFDVAIIGCGAYGFPLTARLKKAGKQVIHMGGATQILFGIKGKRWNDHPTISKLYNEHWVSPQDDEKPEKFSLVENGCYW